MDVTQEDLIVNDLIKRLQVFYLDVEALASQLSFVYQKYPHRIQDVKEALKGQLSPRLEKNLLMLAHDKIIPEMVPDTSNVTEILSHYPKAEQQKYYDDKAKINTTNGEFNIFEMSSDQLKSVFDKKAAKVRTVPQQQLFEKAKIKPKPTHKPMNDRELRKQQFFDAMDKLTMDQKSLLRLYINNPDAYEIKLK